MEDLTNIMNDKEYFEFLESVKQDIVSTRRKVLSQANNEVILMYYRIGKGLIEKSKYGNSFIDTLASDLKLEFPNMKGISSRNLRYMKKFAKEFEYNSILQHDVAKLPWTTITTIMDKIKDDNERVWYAEKTLENLWSRTILEHQIATNLYSRQALLDNKISNYKETLPDEMGKRALEMLKDPYIFDIADYGQNPLEKDIEDALVSNITNLLLEFRKRFRLCRKTISFRSRWRRLLSGLIILQFRLKMLCCSRIKDCEVYTRICRKIKFLFKCSRYVIKERRR